MRPYNGYHISNDNDLHAFESFYILRFKIVLKGNNRSSYSTSIMYVKNTLNPVERKSSVTCTREIIQVDISPKNAVHLKLVIIYRNPKITAADDDEFYTMLEEILLSQHECVIMGVFNLPNIDWTMERPTPAPSKKLMQLLADYNPTHVHETTRQNNILDLVISTEEQLILNLKITDKIGQHQAITFSIKTENGNIASEKKTQL